MQEKHCRFISDSGMCFAEAEEALQNTPVTDIAGMPGGSNEVKLVLLEDGSKGVFKPGIGERCLEIEESCYKLYKRERAAYLISRFLGFNIVPPTVIRKINGVEGSLQMFIEAFSPGWGDELPEEEMYAVSVFDYLIWNKDRKSANILLDAGLVFTIDNGLAFDNWFQYLIIDNLESYVFGRKAPESVVKNILSFARDVEAQAELINELENLLPSNVIEAFFYRLKLVEIQLSKNDSVINSEELVIKSSTPWMDNGLRYSN